MMKCEIIRDLLPLYMDNVCSRESSQLVEDHLAGCKECREEKQKMKQSTELDEMSVQQNMDEEKLLEQGKKNIEDKVKRDFLFKGAVIDLFINAFIAAFVLYTIQGEVLSILGKTTAFLVGAAMPVMFIVWEIIFLVKDSRNKEVPVSQMIAMSSICLKILAFVIAAIVGIVIMLSAIF